MSTVTLAESAKLSQDDLVVGVIENVIETDQFYQVVPFEGVDGNAISYNRENALGGAGVVAVGGTITGDQNPIPNETAAAKDPATFTNISTGLTTILGDAEVNGLIDTTRSDKQDQTAVQIASKAKNVGRIYRWMLINGTASSTQFDGLINLCATGQTIAATGANGDQLDFDVLDWLQDLVKAKDGIVDFYCMHTRERRMYRQKLRALGGASVAEMFELPSGEKVIAYSGVPIFVNDWIPITQTQGGSTDATTVFAGCFDDGSRQMGLAGLHAEKAMGIKVKDVGEKEGADEHIWRVIWYCGLALFSEKALACATGITPTDT